ncbi:MAG TPA: bifunctional 4-hydroxy-2-oxoglutarate aldolase/2-dehydro-3-deoxy-phosphogluconate aldolase [Propionicimonas sp.]
MSTTSHVTTLGVDHLGLPDHGPVIPVVVISDVDLAVPLARALVAGGVRVIEVTLRTAAALDAIAAISAAVPEAVVGAGTVLDADQARDAAAAGARFAVSPGLIDDVDHACRDHGLPLLPGAATATEIMAARARGYRLLKLFPAEVVGGRALLRSLAGPLPDMRFCPTGGLTVQSVPEYLALPNVVVCGGTWLTPADAVLAQDWERITRLAREAAALGPARQAS